MSRNHICLVVFLTTVCLTLSLISAYHNDMFSHLDNSDNTTAPSPPARRLGSALSSHSDNSDNTTAPSPPARAVESALSALSRHLDNRDNTAPRSYLGTAVAVTILVVGVLILAYFFALVLFPSPPAEAVEEKVEEESKLPEKENEKEEEKKKEREEEVHDDEAFWDGVLTKDGRGKAKSAKHKEREDQTNRRGRRMWESEK